MREIMNKLNFIKIKICSERGNTKIFAKDASDKEFYPNLNSEKPLNSYYNNQTAEYQYTQNAISTIRNCQNVQQNHHSFWESRTKEFSFTAW